MGLCVYRAQRLKYSVYLKTHKASCFGGVRAVTTEASFLLCAFMDDFLPVILYPAGASASSSV